MLEGNLDDVISGLQELRQSLPDDSNPSLDISIGSYYGSETIDVVLYYTEEETDEEFEKRKADLRKARALKKKQKEEDAIKRKQLYEQLKKEFES